jgi:hypothetical protein
MALAGIPTHDHPRTWPIDLGGLANGSYSLRAWSLAGSYTAPVVVAR